MCRYSAQSTGEAILHRRERQRLARMRHERRRADYLAGRWAAKAAVTHLCAVPEPAAIWLEPGVLHQPVLGGPGTGDVAVSLTHSQQVGAAVAFDVAHPVGIDLERADPLRAGTLHSALTPGEGEITRGLRLDPLLAATALWTAKEALAKFLRVGLSIDMSLLEVAAWRTEGEWWRLEYRHVVSMKALVLAVDDWLLALCVPIRTAVSAPGLPGSLSAALACDLAPVGAVL
ncbi:4'-phosphopantetheinyl transferase family protein [Actinoplanes aureus]|uniref:4'-phosphopantetheinyl transferase superfamily protein n=1 Tax=Actinoplanes aureus TaxID=2792083 RepID=A0A931CF83_9ACTN|nr:4'-phosphopantetheinyl transferase superfamily protein [Actinoplanes aureus]MBG0566151.1 4'-phosphopantetheinyl transferase superfamily protein [Actinoplanes aureus]